MNSKFLILICLLIAISIATTASAVIENKTFNTPEQESLYKDLITELRCPKCQNQNIADSNAELATDLREKVYEMVNQGKNESEIKTYMLDRFGDFVLYNPRFTSKTWLLWLGPFLILAIVLFFCYRLITKNIKALEEDDSHS